MNQHTPIGSATTRCKKALILFAVFISYSVTLFATYASYRAPFYRGYLILKNKDSLYGEIKIEQLDYSFRNYRDRDEVVLITIDRCTGANKELRINRCNIAFCRLFYKLFYIGGIAYSEHLSYPQKEKSDSIVQLYTDYKNITWDGHIYLARLLASDKADVYDFYQNPEKEITDPHPYLDAIPVYQALFGSIPLLVVADGNVERVPTRFTLQLRYSRSFLRFINRRYKTHLRITDFGSNMDIFAYLASAG